MTATTVAAQLAALGRPVPEGTLQAQLDELGGLAPARAESLLLATYGVSPDGDAEASFAPERGPWAALRDLLARVRPAVVFVAVAAVAGVVPGIVVPLLLRLFVNSYLGNGEDQWVAPILIGLVGAALVTAVVVGLQWAVLRLAVLRLSKSGQVGLTWHVLTMRIPELNRFGGGDLVARANAQQRLAFQAGCMMPLAAVNVLNIAVYTVALLLLHLGIGLTAITVAALSALASLAVLRRRRAIQATSDAAFLALSEATSELVAAMESVRAAAWEQFAFVRWTRRSNAAGRALGDLGIANQWVVLVPATATAAGLGAVLGVGSLLVAAGSVSLGTVIAAQAFTVLLLQGLAMLVWFGVLFQSVASASSQVRTVAEVPLDPEVIDVGDEARSGSRLAGAVAVRDVTFGYSREQLPFLEHLDLAIPAGSRVAVVGTSGSGKTTVARLVIGELRPWSGHVELDGTPRLAVPRSARTRGVAYVPQQSVLFPGTLWENLTVWDDTVTEEQVRRAARDACIEDAVLSRAGGFHAVVTGGDGGFSGGELQRIAIARALVPDPAVLVLDVATSALDPVVEAEVEHNLRRRGCTCLVVAHRLSTIRDADRIVVLADGRVVQQGRFEELRSADPFAGLIRG